MENKAGNTKIDENSGTWSELLNTNIAGKELDHIKNWKDKYTISDLKKLCLEKGYSGFILTPNTEGGTWEEYKDIDMSCQGDMEIIKNWKEKYSLEDLKKIVEEKGYSAISYSDTRFDHAALKKFDYQ